MNELNLRFPIGCTFLGVNCSQTWADFLLWERFLNAHHEVKSLIELGTGEGGFSRYLLIQAYARNMTFMTFDSVDCGHGLESFSVEDVLDNPHKVIPYFDPPTILFCDNGDKTLEVHIYTPFLEVGDFVVVHDWGTEISPENIPPQLEMINEDWCEELHSPTRIFRKAIL